MSEPSDSNLSNLTEEQKEFLRQCDEDFADRFTDSDPEYVKVRDRTKLLPPIEDPWNPIPFRDRDSQRDRGRFRDRDHRDRDHRDYRDRDGWRNRYGRDNYHPRYDNRRRDYNRYNRSPYQSNYYRK